MAAEDECPSCYLHSDLVSAQFQRLVSFKPTYENSDVYTEQTKRQLRDCTVSRNHKLKKSRWQAGGGGICRIQVVLQALKAREIHCRRRSEDRLQTLFGGWSSVFAVDNCLLCGELGCNDNWKDPMLYSRLRVLLLYNGTSGDSELLSRTKSERALFAVFNRRSFACLLPAPS